MVLTFHSSTTGHLRHSLEIGLPLVSIRLGFRSSERYRRSMSLVGCSRALSPSLFRGMMLHKLQQEG